MIVPYGLRFCFDCVLGSLFLRSSAVIRSAIFGGLVLGFSELMDAAHRALEQAFSRSFRYLAACSRRGRTSFRNAAAFRFDLVLIFVSFTAVIFGYRLPDLIPPRRFETVG
jgi:hypothetical protein